MLKPVRFPQKFFRSRQSLLGAFGASAGIMGLVFCIVSIHHALYARASEAGPLATNLARTATDSNWRQTSLVRARFGGTELAHAQSMSPPG